MAFSTYTVVAKTVQALAISAIGSNLAAGQNMSYTLSDGTIIPVEGVQKRLGAAYKPAVGDYIVIDAADNLVLWPAAQFAAAFSAGGETVTVQNSAGSVQVTNLAVVNGVVSLPATDAIVSNGGTAVLHTSSGTVSSGNAGLNSPVTFEIAAGVVTDVKASA